MAECTIYTYICMGIHMLKLPTVVYLHCQPKNTFYLLVIGNNKSFGKLRPLLSVKFTIFIISSSQQQCSLQAPLCFLKVALNFGMFLAQLYS